ncbi:MAG: YvcK family protein [Candidatus Aenigmarchaeota archaeon]|nr:YvcK family protein [Candidatus Aenigmarchaeota archaeon]MDW8160219.1 YvcK family protein [Candidatus Aenigmarchaeota archaeon]
MTRKVKIVCFGGGSAVPKLILESFKERFHDKVELIGITSMVDNGGSTGALRKEFNVLPPGDIRRHMLALSEAEDWKKKIWEFRFAKNIELSPGHYGHNFANVFIAGLEYILGDFEKVLEICHEFLKIKIGKALPATLDKVQLIAELEDGSIVEGEDEIDVGTNHDRNLKIKRVFLKPENAKAYQKALEEVKSADFLIIGPGDLYSSLIPCFLANGWKEAMKRSVGKKIFICPAMNKFGETQGFSIRDYVEEIEKYIGCPVDYVIFNTKSPSKERIERYGKKFLIEAPKVNEGLDEKKYIGRDLLLEEGEIEYDKEKFIKIIRGIIGL